MTRSMFVCSLWPSGPPPSANAGRPDGYQSANSSTPRLYPVTLDPSATYNLLDGRMVTGGDLPLHSAVRVRLCGGSKGARRERIRAVGGDPGSAGTEWGERRLRRPR